MTLKKDIIERIHLDFKGNSDDAMTMLTDAIDGTAHLGVDRVIRCIVYLSQGDLTKLNEFIKRAIQDTRDVMLWAEYINIKIGENPIRVRDFNKTFDESNLNVNG